MSDTAKSTARDNAPLYVLVDYDNVLPQDRAKGVEFVIHKIVDALATMAGPVMPRNIKFRLYGGWYNSSNMTRYAQGLVKSSRYFMSPIPRVPTTLGAQGAVCIMAELARTLLSVADSRQNSEIINTHRSRNFPLGRYQVVSRKHSHCLQENCFQEVLSTFFYNGLCPLASTDVDLISNITCEEQKLVDVMLATDLLHLAFSKRSQFVAVVSSDDDMWPAIIETSSTGMILFHIHTRSRTCLEHYEQFVKGPRYIVKILTEGA